MCLDSSLALPPLTGARCASPGVSAAPAVSSPPSRHPPAPPRRGRCPHPPAGWRPRAVQERRLAGTALVSRGLRLVPPLSRWHLPAAWLPRILAGRTARLAQTLALGRPPAQVQPCSDMQCRAVASQHLPAAQPASPLHRFGGAARPAQTGGSLAPPNATAMGFPLPQPCPAAGALPPPSSTWAASRQALALTRSAAQCPCLPHCHLTEVAAQVIRQIDVHAVIQQHQLHAGRA